MSARSALVARVQQVRKRGATVWETARDRALSHASVRLVVEVARRLNNHDATQMAASLAYYALLSIFPLLLGLISLFGFFLDAETIRAEILDLVTENLPGSADLVEENLEQIMRLRGPVGLVSLVVLFWTASVVFGSVSRALNRAWDVKERRPFYLAKPRHLLMAVFAGILMLASLTTTAAVQALLSLDLPFASAADIAIGANVAGRLSALAFSFLVFLLVYWFTPNAPSPWSQVWPGALLAAGLFELAKTFFVLYLEEFADYRALYGSLASVVVVLLWFYISALILIVGAEFNVARWKMRMGEDDQQPGDEIG